MALAVQRRVDSLSATRASGPTAVSLGSAGAAALNAVDTQIVAGALTTPDQDFPPQSFEGTGPLTGMLLQGKQLTGAFQDNGKNWLPILDKWGNAWLLLCSDSYKAVQFDSTFGVPDIYLDTAGAQVECYEADLLNFKAQGWDVEGQAGNDPFTNPKNFENWSEWNTRTGGALFEISGGPARTHGPVRGSDNNNTPQSQPFAVIRGKQLRDQWVTAAVNQADATGVTLPVGFDAGAYLPANPMNAPFHTPWIDGVPIQLPVAAADQADFGGWVVCRVNRWTRTAVITGLYYGGWGDPDVDFDFRTNFNSWLAAVGKTILGVLAIVVGVISLVYGNVAGVAMIAGGVTTIVEAWYDFAKHLHDQETAINNTIAAGGTIAKVAADAKKRAQDAQNVTTTNWWLIAAIAGGALLLLVD